MWLATKFAAGRAKMPSDALLVDQLGSPEDARRYRKLVRDFPEVERGPDQEIADHYTALKQAFDKENEEATRQGAEGTSETLEALERNRPSAPPPPAPAVPNKFVRSPEEIEAERLGIGVTPDLKGMPQRVPGQYVPAQSDAMFPRQHMPGYEFGLPRRAPGDTFRPSPYSGPATRFAPPTPTHDEWVQGLAEKGIYLNPDGTRMTPEQMAAPLPQRPLRGQQIWEEFTRPAPSAGRHRAASKVVIGYISEKLAGEELIPDPKWMAESPAYAAWFNRYNKMRKAGWDLTEDSGGNYWHKEIEGKHHFLVSEPDGWTHYTSNSPHSYYGGGFGTGPYKDIDEALLQVKYPTRGFSGSRSMEDSVHRPGGLPARSEPMEMLPGGPKAKGKFQTLNSIQFQWEDE